MERKRCVCEGCLSPLGNSRRTRQETLLGHKQSVQRKEKKQLLTILALMSDVVSGGVVVEEWCSSEADAIKIKDNIN